MSAGPIVWVDVETDGLNAADGNLLEVACIITDADADEILFEYESLVAYDQITIESICELSHPRVQEMHTENGIWEAILAGEGKPLATISAELCAIIREYACGVIDGESYRPPLAGSNVANFDRLWIRQHLPAVEKCLHYRNIDVSTVKEICARRYCKQFQFKGDGPPAHRTMADIRH